MAPLGTSGYFPSVVACWMVKSVVACWMVRSVVACWMVRSVTKGVDCCMWRLAHGKGYWLSLPKFKHDWRSVGIVQILKELPASYDYIYSYTCAYTRKHTYTRTRVTQSVFLSPDSLIYTFTSVHHRAISYSIIFLPSVRGTYLQMTRWLSHSCVHVPLTILFHVALVCVVTGVGFYSVILQ